MDLLNPEDDSSSDESETSDNYKMALESVSNASSPSENEEMSDGTVPSLGQTFDTEEAFALMVFEYARRQGFSIRRSRVVKTKGGELRKRDLVCSYARTSGLKKHVQVRNTALKSTDCPFRVRASFDVTTCKWHVISVVLDHNHNMVSSEQRKFMNSERRLPDEVKSEVLTLHRAGITPSQIRNVLKVKFGDKSSWLYDDIYNFLYHQAGGLGHSELDAQAFIETLQQLQNDYPYLSFNFKLDDSTQRLQKVIWMFPEQKLAYSRFSDVMVFDNTYKTNRFKMPFGVFTGVNNHGQSVCFAGSLVDNETTESFVWLFKSFLEMVAGNSPKVILTDDDKAIGNAINETFAINGTTHRLCHWHLLRNLMKNLLSVLGSEWANFLSSFLECVANLDEDDFRRQWEALKGDYPPAESYLLRMERTITKWAPCYCCDIFVADMTTSQRGESMNNLLKYYMDATTTLRTFLEAFACALEVRNEVEEFAKYREENFSLRFRTGSPLEQQAYALFTWYAFQKLQEQLIQSQSYRCSETSR
jgi:zinc finger SWIM domain-containing protein 3